MSKPQRILMLAFPDCEMPDVTWPLQMSEHPRRTDASDAVPRSGAPGGVTAENVGYAGS
jgi:hypothetical protein